MPVMGHGSVTSTEEKRDHHIRHMRTYKGTERDKLVTSDGKWLTTEARRTWNE